MLRTFPHARALIGALVLALLAATAFPAAAVVREDGSPGPINLTSSSFIVRLIEAPVVGYEGGIAGLAATRTNGKKIDVKDAKVQRYVAHLAKRHQDVAAAVGVSTKFYDYFYVFNGFAATLTAKQANALRKRADVASVEKDALGRVDTASTPAFLGLTEPGTGLWAQLGGVEDAGEDVVVGVIDTGIWPEHPSFSDQLDLSDPEGNKGKRTLAYGPAPAGWSGICQSGEQFSQKDCSNKIIGARYYLSGFGKFGIIKSDFKSPRDADGHGTHTTSTAAGNHAVPATGQASLLGTISGMAPRARIAAYKVCWNGAAGGCAGSDSVAAIDQAVADGVDVINFSISGTSTNYLDAVEVAYLFAADAGVFVSTSAGNSGPDASTVAHISPWLASVAAGTHNRSGTATVTLGSPNNAVFTGASLTAGVGPAPLVSSTAVGRAGADATQVSLCFLGTLDPARAAGKIVQCDRGTNARTDKSAAVKQAGGVGMILTNTSENSLNADFHTVPTVHLSHVDRPAILAYITAAGASATATLSRAVVNNAAPAPEVAAFSSRGPSLAGGGDILKPDFMAPGVDILAAVSPTGGGRLFDLMSGTSMSSPHVAGIGALLTQAHPNWSPAAIRSALATTAGPAVGIGATSPFNIGSGQIRPNLANNPGLVYDAGFVDYLAFLKGQGLCCGEIAGIPVLDASDLNQPTIAIGDLAGTQTVTRRVTNVGSTAATYNASVSISGLSVLVTPSTLALAPGETKSFTVGFTRTDAPLNAYTFGSLTWSDVTHTVQSRLAVRPVAIAAPASISSTLASGSATYSVKFGYDGPFTATPRGLVAATKTLASVADDPTNNFNTAAPDTNQGFTVHTFDVLAGTKYARFSLFDSDDDGDHDLDMYVYKGATGTELVGSSGGGTSAEQVDLVNPAADTYRVYIHGWQTAGGGTANYTLSSWQVPSTATSLSVSAPTIATTGGTGTIVASWIDLAPATRHLGLVTYHDATTELGRTVVSVNVP